MASSSSSSSPEISNATYNQSFDRFSYKYATQDEVLEDLSSRFILNLPDEELTSVERICFQVEQAHWYYEDFIREENPKFPSLPLKKFSAMLFQACPLLNQWSADHEQAFTTFMQYKTRVPVYGAIMLNNTWDKCVLVKGWKSSSGWGFPKGKINQAEEPYMCAIREVLEETGYDISSKIRKKDCVEISIKEQSITLYIVGGVPEDYPFETRTRKEISKIEWFRLSDLPTWKRNKAAPGKFYLISPFVPALKDFIRRNANSKSQQRKHRSNVQVPATDDSAVEEEDDAAHSQPTYQVMTQNLDRYGSSSQSSSADIGGPQTPSPLTSQAQAVKVQDNSQLNTITDPQLARLLNNLSISAKAVYNTSETKEVITPAIPDPVPRVGVANKCIGKPDESVRSDHEHDLSANPADDSSAALPSHSVETSSSPRVVQESQTARSLPVQLNNLSPSVNIQSEASERNAKRLALLESITSELPISSTTPVVPLVQVGQPSTMHQPWIRPPYKTLLHPGISPSVPPSGFNAHPYQPPFPPRDQIRVQPGGPIGHDLMNGGARPAFIRPRTSNSVPQPSIPVHPYPGHSLSMNQSQLLSLLAPHASHPPPSSGPFPPHMHGPAPSFPPLVKQPNPFPVITPVPLQHNGIPQSAPPTSPSFSPRQIHNRANLLSILNTGPTHPTDTTRTPHPPFGNTLNALPYHVLNGNMHR